MRTFSENLQAAYDFWRPNRWGIRPYLLKDGRKHPFAIIVPGGAYGMVCSYVEGLPFAKALNEKGYHAIVAYYRVKNKAKYPAPQDDLERAIREVFAHAATGTSTRKTGRSGAARRADILRQASLRSAGTCRSRTR